MRPQRKRIRFNKTSFDISFTMGTNSMYTPLIFQSWKVHNFVFSNLYPFPIKIRISSESKTISLEQDYPFKVKYGFFLIMELVITFLFAFGCTSILLVLQLFLPSTARMKPFEVVMCICLVSVNVLEWGTYLWMLRAPEFFPAMNQLLKLEQKRN